jgi:hypothetical protein
VIVFKSVNKPAILPIPKIPPMMSKAVLHPDSQLLAVGAIYLASATWI